MEDTHKEAGGVVAGALDIETHSMCHNRVLIRLQGMLPFGGLQFGDKFPIIFSESFLGG